MCCTQQRFIFNLFLFLFFFFSFISLLSHNWQMCFRQKEAKPGKYLIIFQSHSVFGILCNFLVKTALGFGHPDKLIWIGKYPKGIINNPLTKQQVFGNNSWVVGALESALPCQKKNPFLRESANHTLTVLSGLLSSKEICISQIHALCHPCISRSRPHKSRNVFEKHLRTHKSGSVLCVCVFF